MDDDDFTCDGTSITFEYGELSARVTMSTNISPDYVHTITRDLAREIIAAAKDLGMTYGATSNETAAAATED